MGKVILDMGMSLDGYAADPNRQALYPIDRLRNSAIFDEFRMMSGAVVMGRGAYDMAGPDGFVGYEYQLPIYVVTHHPPQIVAPGENGKLTFMFVTDGFASAVRQAKAAAADQNVVVVGGITTARECIKAGLLDEIQLRLLPIMVGAGERLFEHMGDKQVELEATEAVDALGITHLRYRVVK
jgi:dihydrofolate reductase